MRFLWVALLSSIFVLPAEARWNIAETQNFRVFSEGPQARLIEQARLLEDFRVLLGRFTTSAQRADLPRLDVFLVDRLEDANPWQPLAPGVAGYYRADAGRISVVALDRQDGGSGELSSQEVLLHEYAHHFLLGARGPAYPAWYVEGFAEYYATATFDRTEVRFARLSPNRTAWLLKAPWLPMTDLLRGRQLRKGGVENAMFYAQSWLLTHYLFRTPGMRDRLLAYLRAYAAGADPVLAFRKHIGSDFGALEARMRTYLRRQATSSRLERAAVAPVDVKLTQLSPAADTLLLRLTALEHGVSPELAPRALAEVRQLAGAAPQDPLARRVAAFAELGNGDAGVARQLLAELAEASPRDPDLLRWRALSLQPLRRGAAAEDIAEARRLLAIAFRLDPQDWRAMHAYVRLHRPLVEPLPPGVLAVLLRAHQLAPQVPEIVLETAVALTHAGRLPEAAVVLSPLARAPHGGEASDIAQTMLERARAGDEPGLLGVLLAVAGRPVPPGAMVMAIP